MNKGKHGHIGRKPEHAQETIPGGVSRHDERVAAGDTQSTGEGAEDRRQQGRRDTWPGGHREGEHTTDDDVRRAGERH